MRRIDLRWTSALLLAIALVSTTGPACGDDAGTPHARKRPVGRASECGACGAEVAADGMEYAVAGRYVPLCGDPCVDAALADPDTALAGRQARAGLFDEKAMPARSASWAWFAAGTYVCAGLLAGAWCAHAAFRRGKSPARWLALGLVFNAPAVVAIALLPGECRSVPSGMGKIPATARPSPCPACGAACHPFATRCGRCGGAITRAAASEAARARG